MVEDLKAVSRFIDDNFRHFNAASLVDAARGWATLSANGDAMMVTLAGAMSTAELGRSLAEMIRAGKVQAISCTGANLEEDLFNLVAHHHYVRLPNYRDLTPDDEAELALNQLNRVTDTCIPEERAIRLIEKKILNQWKNNIAFPHEHLMAILDEIDAEIPTTDSWLIAARDAGIPIYVPGWEDSTLGNIFTAHCIKGEVDSNSVKTGIDYMMHLADWYRNSSHPIGFLQIGGGIAGDFPICVVPMLRQDMGEDSPLWGWFAQISESTTSYGGYSGAPPSEKITWGKLAPSTPMHVIESDATIVAPILFSYILN